MQSKLEKFVHNNLIDAADSYEVDIYDLESCQFEIILFGDEGYLELIKLYFLDFVLTDTHIDDLCGSYSELKQIITFCEKLEKEFTNEK